MKKNLKKYLIITVSILLVVGIGRHYYIYKKSTDMSYVIKRYMTKGLFNNHKIAGVSSESIIFSDGKTSVVEVSGYTTSHPVKAVKYKLFLNVNKKGIWKVLRHYPNP